MRIAILCFLFTLTGAAHHPDRISINCGGGAAVVSGRKWSGDAASKGSSSVKRELITAADPVPYSSARISRSQFSYSFHLTPGQKFLRLHFNPMPYFQSSDDLFTVEAGAFTLLANFSASITARALSLSVFSKEFCIIVHDNQPLSLVFSPETEYNYAFINGIEIISVPPTVAYCHGGDSGVNVLGQKSVIYVDNTTALERVYHQNLNWGWGDVGGMFGVWASDVGKKGGNFRWRVRVDVGFRYLIRLHLCEAVMKMDFTLVIDDMVALSGADLLREGGNQSLLWYNYVVMVEGHKREGTRDISVSLVSQHTPLQGFEVFKLSNHDRSLASPNPLLPNPTRDSPSQIIPTLVNSLLGRTNAIATVVFTAICLLNIVVHLLLKMREPDMTEIEEESKPFSRAKRLCRTFSLAEIQSATNNFKSGSIAGKGGFGIVYKGFMDNGREIVAIKRAKPDSKQGELQFWTEVETLSELRHVNLVSLIGYCSEQKEMILVYEYMPNGTLADHLYKLARKNLDFYPLSWKERLKICIGAIRALDYLHTGQGIIHRDVKASNILLDEKFVAKVSDFGLAKAGGLSESQSQDSTNLKGTFGYIDPNFFTTRKLTKESDIYSFGVVLLEVLCGKPAVEPLNDEDKRSLTTWGIDNIRKGRVDDIVAPSLRGEISPDSLATFLKVTERCLDDEPKKRPTAALLVIKLVRALQQQEKAESLVQVERTSVEDVVSSADESQNENMNYLSPKEQVDKENDEIRSVSDALPCIDKDRTSLSIGSRPMAPSFSAQTFTSLQREQSNNTMMIREEKNGKKSMISKISRKLWPWDAFRKTRKSSNKADRVHAWQSAPLSRRTINTPSGGNTITNKKIGGMSSTPAVRIFSFKELKAATRNFHGDSVVGDGGFGTVYKGRIHEKSSAKEGSGSLVAVKKLNHQSMQGFQEWQRKLKQIIDPRMEGRYASKSAAKVAELALSCLDMNPKRRPTMQQVVETLEGAAETPSPRQPRVHFSPQPRYLSK
ncbi:hypothetical protein SASPL_151775 [Salvia splendens]|uniref:Protein kinase domain-containing protein n=1 Tax=Salvia splendens TaxID=180675 RepID=A0A8X8YZE2_SALSN|nr:hypothetical protein SASPL_151775 [Salvia splendens]